MKSLRKYLFIAVASLGYTFASGVAVAGTTGSVCNTTHCLHCINGFCVICDLKSGSCRPAQIK